MPKIDEQNVIDQAEVSADNENATEKMPDESTQKAAKKSTAKAETKSKGSKKTSASKKTEKVEKNDKKAKAQSSVKSKKDEQTEKIQKTKSTAKPKSSSKSANAKAESTKAEKSKRTEEQKTGTKKAETKTAAKAAKNSQSSKKAADGKAKSDKTGKAAAKAGTKTNKTAKTAKTSSRAKAEAAAKLKENENAKAKAVVKLDSPVENEVKPEIEAEPALGTIKTSAPAFDRDAIFAEVFGLNIEKAAKEDAKSAAAKEESPQKQESIAIEAESKIADAEIETEAEKKIEIDEKSEAEAETKLTLDAGKKSAPAFDRDAIFAEVFGLNIEKAAREDAAESVEASEKKGKQKEISSAKASESGSLYQKLTPGKKKEKSAAKAEEKQNAEFSLSHFGKIEIPNKKQNAKSNDAPRQAEQKQKPTNTKDDDAQAQTESGGFMHNFFKFGKVVKKAEVKQEEKAEANTVTEAEESKVETKAQPFDRDAIFAEVFGIPYDSKVPIAPVEAKAEETQDEAATPSTSEKAESEAKLENIEASAKVNKSESKAEEEEEKPKQQPNADDELNALLEVAGDYPLQNVSKLMSEEDVRFAENIDKFFLNRGYAVAPVPENYTENLSGVILNDMIYACNDVRFIINFFAKAKYALSGFDPKKGNKLIVKFEFSNEYEKIQYSKLLAVAMKYGLVYTNNEKMAYFITGDNKNVITTFIPPVGRVPQFIKGYYLEGYAHKISKQVVERIAAKRNIQNWEVRSNVIIRKLYKDKENPNLFSEEYLATNEFDTVISIGKQVFIIEEKSSREFYNFPKFHDVITRLNIAPENYMILLINKNEERIDAVEWLFEYRIANIETFSQRLEKMITSALDAAEEKGM